MGIKTLHPARIHSVAAWIPTSERALYTFVYSNWGSRPNSLRKLYNFAFRNFCGNVKFHERDCYTCHFSNRFSFALLRSLHSPHAAIAWRQSAPLIGEEGC